MNKLARAGSQRWIQVAVELRPDVLDGAVRQSLELGHAVTLEWVSPRQGDGFREYRDMAALRKLGMRELPRRELSDFWPARGPVWDALGLTSDGRLLFVEAKAHIAEMVSPPTKAMGSSRTRIEKSLAEARRYYAPRTSADWAARFYQYANRLAHLFLVRHVNRLNAHLVFLYFVNAPDVPVSATEGEWRGAIQLLHASLGLRAEHVDPYVHDLFVDVGPLAAAVA